MTTISPPFNSIFGQECNLFKHCTCIV